MYEGMSSFLTQKLNIENAKSDANKDFVQINNLESSISSYNDAIAVLKAANGL